MGREWVFNDTRMEYVDSTRGDNPVTIKKGTKLRVKVISAWSATTSSVRGGPAGGRGGGAAGRAGGCGERRGWMGADFVLRAQFAIGSINEVVDLGPLEEGHDALHMSMK